MVNLDVAIKSIVNDFHWTPNVIDNLFCDDIDYHGIVYWHNNLIEMHAKIPKTK